MAIIGNPSGAEQQTFTPASGTKSVETLAFEANERNETDSNVEITPEQASLVLNAVRGIIDLKHADEYEGVLQSDYILNNLHYALATLPEEGRSNSYASRLLKLASGISLPNPSLHLVEEARVASGPNAADAIAKAWHVIGRHESPISLGADIDGMIESAPDSETRASLQVLAAAGFSSKELRFSQHYVDSLERELRS